MPADLWNNALVKPPFASNPPLKVNVPAKTYGLVLAILGVIGAIFGLIGTIVAFTWTNGVLSDLCSNTYYTNTALCTVTTHSQLAGLGELIALAGAVIGAWGGFQMYQGNHQGRSLLVYGLAVGVVGQLIYTILWGFSYYVAGFIVFLIIYAVLYYFAVISRFPDEQPLVAATAPMGYPPYGGPPMAPPPPPPGV